MHTFTKTIYDFHASDIAKHLDEYKIELAFHVGQAGSTFGKELHYHPMAQEYRVRAWHKGEHLCQYSTSCAKDAFDEYNTYQVENYPEN